MFNLFLFICFVVFFLSSQACTCFCSITAADTKIRVFTARNRRLIIHGNLHAVVSVVYMTVYSLSLSLGQAVCLIYIRRPRQSVRVTVAGSVPSVTLEALCKQAGEKQGELFYYCHIIDVLCYSTRNSPLNDSSCSPAPCLH